MKIAYFDIVTGICGNMILGALIDAGVDVDHFKKELSKLDLGPYNLEIKKEAYHHLSGTLVSVSFDKHAHKKRCLDEIEAIINKSELDEKIKNKSISVFRKLGEVESKIHNVPLEKVHFHEVGAIDSFIDIVGAVICLEYLKIEKIYSSAPVNGSGGWVDSLHGKIPNPAPATLELLKNIPSRTLDMPEELTTPTGAAVLVTLAEGFTTLPEGYINQIGYGFGDKKLKDLPNLLRVIIFDTKQADLEMDFISVIETNIDNMNPEHYDWFIDEALKIGALDVYLIPIIMKKSRPGTCLTILSPYCLEKKMVEFILKNTTSFGVRISNLRREKLIRKFDTITTKYGAIKVKKGYMNDVVVKISPEYEDVKKIAQEYKISPQEIINEVIKKGI